MLTSAFDFTFPEEQIALRPLPRGEARLMVLSAAGPLPADLPPLSDARDAEAPETKKTPESREWAFGQAGDLVGILQPGDALALNDTKVLRARLRGALDQPAPAKAGGGAVEILLLKPAASSPGVIPGNARASENSGAPEATAWECMAKPGKKLQPGRSVNFGGGLSAEVTAVLAEGERVLRFNKTGADFFAAVESLGEIPLPPYIRRTADAADAETYQTVFAANLGSVAAPTASLHLSEAMLAAIEAKGVRIVKLTLHVGAGTFRPVQTEQAEDHPMHSEAFTLSEESARILNETRRKGGRIFAVGTTASRVLETCADAEGVLRARTGDTDIFIYPGYRWKAVDALLTNFHWPKSTLFMLVAARLGENGTERAKKAYAEAIARGFRLFSYGDGMLII